eukprot:TRINITY_DN9088_c0_g1_i2.p1 TRINITY_DN9088_c0_g1~~TRINITY_DN9088_c0_g1_i2.p1  ORF type:complete len:207 (+),score=18.74 TRINITY_DN9088_c0_g1_i2:64-621(+)
MCIRDRLCCILHFSSTIDAIKAQIYDKQGIIYQGLSMLSNGLKMLNKQLKAHFSDNYVDLLCSCLQIDSAKRPNTKQLKTHAFFSKSKDFKGPLVSLQETLKVSTECFRQSYLPSEYQEASKKQLERLCNALLLVLPTSSGDETSSGVFWEMSENNQKIKDLSYELGVPPETILRHLEKVQGNGL